MSSTENGTVVVLSRDIFFGMRIRNVLKQLDYRLVLVQDTTAFGDAMESVDHDVVLGIVDFNQAVIWDELSAALALDVPVIAFGAHTDVEGFRAAKDAGVARVVANGSFNTSLPALLDRHAVKR